MSKILIVTNHSYMFYRFRLELVKKLMEDHEVVLSTPFVGHEDDLQDLGLRCINTEMDRRGINPKSDLKLLSTYRKLLKQEQPDMVVTYSIKPNIYMGMACRSAKIPYCANVQGLGTAFQRPLLSMIVSRLYKAAFRGVKVVFFENCANSELFRQKRIMKAEKQYLLNGAGVNLEAYAYAPYPENEKFHFLYLGRIMKEKGVEELFEAIRNLQKKYRDKFVLDIVGFYEEEYEAQVQCLQDEGLVEFHGFKTDPKPYYKKADCVVLPSYHEGMSNVLLEAAAMGRPLIASGIPGCREAIEDGVTGYLCAPQDAGSLTKKMEWMMEQSRSQRAEMGLAGHRKMEREFSKQQIVEKTIRVMLG